MMKHHPYRLIFCLTAEVGAVCFILYTVQFLHSAAVLPHFTLPHIALLCLLPQALCGDAPKLLPTALLSAAVFGLLPLCAGLVTADFAWRLAAAGGITMLITAALFSSARQRLRSAPCTKAAQPLPAFLLFLALQAFSNLWL